MLAKLKRDYICKTQIIDFGVHITFHENNVGLLYDTSNMNLWQNGSLPNGLITFATLSHSNGGASITKHHQNVYTIALLLLFFLLFPLLFLLFLLLDLLFPLPLLVLILPDTGLGHDMALKVQRSLCHCGGGGVCSFKNSSYV